MREIKFRQPIFKNDGGFLRWHYWGFITRGSFVGPELMTSNLKAAQENSQQYTGLKANGKEIYEGDIVHFEMSCNLPSRIGEVFFKSEGSIDYCFKVPKEGNFGLNSYDINCYEVIGNIYENPELLEGGTT